MSNNKHFHDKEDGLGKAGADKGFPKTAARGGKKREMKNGESRPL